MKSAADLVQEHLLYMTTDLTQWRALYNENAVWEFAYASSAGLPGVARGITEIAQRVEGFVARVDGLSFGDLKIYPIDRADAVFAEFRARHTLLVQAATITRTMFSTYVPRTERSCLVESTGIQQG